MQEYSLRIRKKEGGDMVVPLHWSGKEVESPDWVSILFITMTCNRSGLTSILNLKSDL